MSKTALIVDDSRTARVVLQKKLETHDLRVDNAESAEEALTYLGVNRPDIIFMDHEMPGMDGLQAVSAIKKNPATATIPIMMYTAQEGELYVGQARALGAVGVLPKEVEPVELSKVLESLRVIGEQREKVERQERREDVASTSGDYPALGDFDADLGILIRELFDQQRAILRRDLLDSHETIATRVIDEIKSPQPEHRERTWPGNLRPVRWKLLSALLAVTALVFATLFMVEARNLEGVQSEVVALQLMLDQQQELGSRDEIQAQRQLDAYRLALDSSYLSAIDAIQWAANQSSMYAFDEMPLGDSRLEVVSMITDRLTELNFEGLVRIETHVGAFCMSITGPGEYSLAAGDQPVVQCDSIGFNPSAAYSRGLRQSVAFANFINLARERSNGRIRYEINTFSQDVPRVSYPARTDAVTAAEWNDIAASNNRVDVSIYPDGSGPLIE